MSELRFETITMPGADVGPENPLPPLRQPADHHAQARDYPMVLGVVVVYSGMLLLLNLLADVIHALLDPRVGLGRG